jgi:hypothetical protein
VTTQEQKIPYWFKAIEEARVLGEFTYEHHRRANDWTTCACGEQDRRIPRYEQDDEDETGARVYAGEPKDDDLSALGCRFAWAVDDDDLDGALALLHQIEARAAVVIAAAEVRS